MRRPWPTLLVIMLGLALMLTACAKRPVGTQASAPAPVASASTPPLPPATAATPTFTPPPGSTPPSPPPFVSPPGPASPAAPPARPSPPPRDFSETPALKDVYFDFDRYNIRADAARTLEGNATWLKSNPNVDLLIEGHCDERGTNEYNLALGERRARSTMNYLVSQGIQASRLTVISYGEERPVCREQNETCWSRNRRAHFLTRGR